MVELVSKVQELQVQATTPAFISLHIHIFIFALGEVRMRPWSPSCVKDRVGWQVSISVGFLLFLSETGSFVELGTCLKGQVQLCTWVLEVQIQVLLPRKPALWPLPLFLHLTFYSDGNQDLSLSIVILLHFLVLFH